MFSLSIFTFTSKLRNSIPDTRLHLHLVLRAGPALVGRVPVRAGGGTSQYFANIFKLFYQIFSPELVPAKPELRADQRVPLRQRRLRHRRHCLLEGRPLPEAALLKR